MASPVFLVHYHEIGLKGHNRSFFERQLIHNIQFACEGMPIEKPVKISGRVLVPIDRSILDKDTADSGPVCRALDNPEIKRVFAVLRSTPGVARVSLGWRTDRNLDAICKLAGELLLDCKPIESFKVDAKRSNTDFDISSMEMNRLIGAYLHELLPDVAVRMDDPDLTVYVHVIQGSAYVYANSEPGVGGLPVGSSGKFVMLLSTGIDSPVAMWSLMHRGAVAVALHFSGAPETDDSSTYLVRDICDALASIGGIRRLCIARIGEYQRRISEQVPPKLRVIFFRRLMIEVANELARREHAKALATGESLGQVASQTMDNIRAVDAVADFPVLRPLIGSDKQEITALARRIGTYDLSIQACSDCCTLFLPKNPETHADLEEVNELALAMDFDAWAVEICDDIEVVRYRCCTSSW